MTDLPSCELVQRFMHEAGFPVANPDDEMVFPAAKFMKLASRLIQHGADQELEACCEWLDNEIGAVDPDDLRAERRSKPPSLKEQALEAQRRMWSGASNHDDWDLVRRALEQLDD